MLATIELSTQICKKCGEEKAVYYFQRNKTYKSGYASTCKACAAKYSKERVRKIKEGSWQYRETGPTTPSMQVCRKCGVEKPIDEFSLSSDNRSGHSHWCKVCMSIYDNSRHIGISGGQWDRRKETPSVKKCPQCDETKPFTKEFFHRHTSNIHGLDSVCKECKSRIFKVAYNELRREVIEHYCGGTPHCMCPGGCRETNIEFLTIDHITPIKRSNPSQDAGVELCKRLKKEGFPEGYRILCYNCNCSRGHRGFCPHEKMNSVEESN